jgi:DNA-directed RNA polymerase subunit RPC12/RpoP
VISGSEFSRQVSFICEAGCSKEFKGKGDDEEIMCPYCGTIGESPL